MSINTERSKVQQEIARYKVMKMFCMAVQKISAGQDMESSLFDGIEVCDVKDKHSQDYLKDL